ncbi:MAG TPA: hypothetical protein VH722_08535 [Alphaproteobacteria bacterium]|jgi:uncharacterized FlgJ-related protein|nr:hypothetical protein [Alphaproteobacteria bacterium]
MRRFHLALSAALLAAAASPAFAAECASPGQAPVIPDGQTATQAQMDTAKQQVQSYVNSLQSLQDCYEARIKMTQKSAKADDLQKMRDAGNAAVTQAQALAATYSAQKKIFVNRAATPATPK